MKRLTKKCRICDHALNVFLSLGKAPISNLWLTKEERYKDDFRYDLEAAFCPDCKMVQLTEFVPYEKYIIPKQEGKTEYLFFSSTSRFMEKHFAEYAKEIEENFLSKGDLVVEIGSNDGILLQAFHKGKYKILGIEPGTNVAEVARKKGVKTWTEFFTPNLAKRIVQEEGKTKAILAANTILNIGDLHTFMRAIDILLDEEGIFVFQDPYIPNILERNSFDQFYDEHIYYFSSTSLSHLMKRHGLEIFNLSGHDVHGGSMRVYVKHKSSKRPVLRTVEKHLAFEREMGLDKLETYQSFATRVSKIKGDLNDLLASLKSQNKKIVGYAATCKSSTVFTYCNIGPEILDYISDSTPDKQGKYSPGKHIPIVSPDKFHEDQPEYALLLAWNHEKEILEKEEEYRKKGGKFILFNPEVRIV